MLFYRCIAAVTLLNWSMVAPASSLQDLVSGQITSSTPVARQVKAARSLGIKRVRVGVVWSTVQDSRGNWHWDQADARIGTVLSAGFSPIVTLIGKDPAVPSPPGGKIKPVPPTEGASVERFGRFAGAVAHRFGPGTDLRPIYYEIWNEPNSPHFWGGPPIPEDYARIAERACSAIKALGPNYRVLALAMEGTPVRAPFRWRATGVDLYQEWAAKATTPTLAKCADGFSMHPYTKLPEMYFDVETALKPYVATYWTGGAAPLIVNSEWGYTGSPGMGDTAALQAARVLRLVLVSTGLGRLVNIYQLTDSDADPSRNGANFGLFTFAGAAKPSGEALRRLMSKIGDWRIDGVGRLLGNPAIFRFTAHGPTRAEVVWAGEGNIPQRYKVPRTASVIDLATGEARSVGDGGVMVSSVPLLVTFN